MKYKNRKTYQVSINTDYLKRNFSHKYIHTVFELIETFLFHFFCLDKNCATILQ